MNAAVSTRAGKLLSIRDLAVQYRTGRGLVGAVRGVSFDVEPGKVTAVVGESGSGKTTVAQSVIGLLASNGSIARGEIELNERRLGTTSLVGLPERRWQDLRGRCIGLIPQDPGNSLNPVKTIGRSISESLRIHGRPSREEVRERVLALLEQVGIDDPERRAKQYPHEFSGGMRQRVVIALALAASPKLVIADEPTTALDVSIQAQIISLLRKLCKEKQTAVMLVTHDMGVIAEAADRIAVMYAGRLIEIGPVEQVLHQPRHPYTQGLMASIPSLGARVEKLNQIDGSMPRLDAIPKGCAFNPRCKVAVPRCLQERPELNFISQNPNLGASACWLNAGGSV